MLFWNVLALTSSLDISSMESPLSKVSGLSTEGFGLEFFFLGGFLGGCEKIKI